MSSRLNFMMAEHIHLETVTIILTAHDRDYFTIPRQQCIAKIGRRDTPAGGSLGCGTYSRYSTGRL